LFHQFQDLLWSDFIRGGRNVIVYLDYGKTWLLDMLKDLQDIAKSGSVTIILADPNDKLQRTMLFQRLKHRKGWTTASQAKDGMMKCLKIASCIEGATVKLSSTPMTYAMVKVDDYALFYSYQLSPEKGKPINSPVYYWNLGKRINSALKDFITRELAVAEKSAKPYRT
jgi:hypothetical protein